MCFNLEIKQLIYDLENKLSKKRLKHSIGTMRAAEMLAKRYGANIEKAKMAGVLHDYAKELSDDEMLKYANEFSVLSGIKLGEPLNILHGSVGAKLVSKRYDILDEEILSAITWHTIGKPNMSLLDKIVYVSDLIEENRKFPDVDFYRELAFNNLEKSLIYSFDFAIKHLMKKNMLINKNTIEARNYLILEEKGEI